MSILELVKSGSLDLRLASLLWLMMEQRASILVAAGPSFAGKTTTLNALLDFLHPDVKEVRLNGWGEDFRFLKDATPSKTYIVAEEFSDYGDYVWGETAQKAFNLLDDGYSLGGTIHARTAKEVLLVLHQYLGISVPLLGRLGAVVNLSATRQRYDPEPIRHIEAVTLTTTVKDGLAIHTIASRESGSDSCIIADDKTLQVALSNKFALGSLSVSKEIEIRRQYLSDLQGKGKVSRDDVREAIIKFYESRRAP